MPSFDVEKLPSIPQVLLKLIEKCHQIDVSFNELAEIIKMDAALTAKIISTASTPTKLNKTEDFSLLLSELGLSTIRAIAITSAVQLFFSQQDEQNNGILKQHWHHALTTAHIARSLAQLTRYSSEDDAYIAGLLHNIGQLALLKKAVTEEQRALSSISIEAGVQLINKWQLNSLLEDAIRYQQATTESILDAPRLVKLINYACKLSYHTQPIEQLTNDGQLLFGLSRPQLDELLDEADNETKQSTKQLGITVTSEGKIETAQQNEQINLKLARQVRSIALLDSVRQHLSTSTDLESTLHIIQQDLKILFGLSHSLCFLYSEADNQLTATASHLSNNEKPNEFLIPVKQRRSLLADSIQQQCLSFSLTPSAQEKLTVVDQQLIRLLKGDGMLCIPLITEQQIIGVLVTGISQQQLPELERQQNLITHFAHEAAQTIEGWQQQELEQQQLLAIEHARQQEHTRKLLHEVNNPLCIVNNYLQLLAVKLGEDHAAQSQLTILKEELERVTGILAQMKNLPQAENTPQGKVDLNALIKDQLSIFRASLFANHSIKDAINLDSTLPPVLGNQNSLKQVITNLVKNAVEAMPEGGTIKLSTHAQVNVNGQLFIELIIADSGHGMTNNTLNNLFKPIVSTKGKDNSGLGLSIVKKLVSDMHGTICCRSEIDGGTEFQVLLPMKKKN